MTTMTAAERKGQRHRIGPASPEHIGALMQCYADLEASQGRTVEAPERQAFGEAVFEALGDGTETVIVATVGKKVAGFMWGQVLSSRFGALPRVFHVRQFYVRPEYRRWPRIGHDLYTAMRGYQRALRIPAVFEVLPQERAKWERRGYRPLTLTMVTEA